MEAIEIFNRIVVPITTTEGQTDYYNHMNYWKSCAHSKNIRIQPTTVEVDEYLKLKEDKPSMFGNLSDRKKYRKLQEYENNYDWRPTKSGKPHFIGLVSPTGERLLPNIFEDVFIQFDTLHDEQKLVPVSNGIGWGLASLGPTAALMTVFRYNAIIPERWERNLFFVQDGKTMKWGALRAVCQSTNHKPHDRNYLTTVEAIMPCMADEIYEDEFMVDDSEDMPSLFFMLRIGNKVGILTDYGYSNIIYDTYETNSRDCSFRLIRKDKKRARCSNWWQPNVKRFT